jgi:DNA-binding LacI/PurR family transcriptional regulator
MSSIAMRTLDHGPGSVTGLLGRRRSRTIGVLSLDPMPHVKASALFAIQRATREWDYLVSIASVPVLNQVTLLMAVARLRALGVDGLLVLAPPGGAVDTLAEVSGELPVVAVGGGPHERLSVVAVDHYAGAVAATRHLLELGHRTVFHIAGPPDRHDAALRLAGWRDTLVAAGAEIPLPLVGDWSSDRGYALGSRLGARDDVTAIFAANDQMALGALRALFEAGRRVPHDVSVVGFDGIPEGEFLRPPLTTVRQNYTELGLRSFQLLRREIDARLGARRHETIPAELILRASTATAA